MSTESVAQFVCEISFETLPPEVIAQAKKAIRDVIGVMVAANGDRAVEAARRMMIRRGGVPESTVVGAETKLPCEAAAFVNTIMANTLDMDDGSHGLPGHKRIYLCHPGCVVVPSSMVVAERQRTSGKALLEAVVAGYEVALTTGWMMVETRDEALAAVPTETGAYGATASAAKLLGLSVEETVNALGIVEAHCPLAPLRFIWTQANMTKEACGWAANTGVSAALLAQAGFGGQPTLYDLPGCSRKPIETLGRRWGIMSLYFKPYSMCRCGHSAIDGILEIVNKYGLVPEDILEIRIGSASGKGAMMSDPRPANTWQAEFSIPFAVGAAIVDGKVGPDQVAETRLSDKAILSLADKVRLRSDPEVDKLLPGIYAAKVEVDTRSNKTFQTFIKYPRGDLENPLTDDELRDKFMTLVAKVVGSDRAGELDRCIGRLEKFDDMVELVDKLS